MGELDEARMDRRHRTRAHQAGSPVVDAADPAAVLTGLAAVDIDGDTRSQGAHADIGANEYKL